MVKQGQFAQVKRTQNQKPAKIRQMKTRNDHQLADDQIPEFLQVRYHLTQSQRQVPVVQETMQRFLNVFLSQRPQTGNWDLTEMLPATLTKLGVLPWQFFYVLDLEWPKMERFLVKEVPALPIANVQRVIPLTADQFSALLGRFLARNWFAQQFRNQPERLQQVTVAQLTALENSILLKAEVAWQQVNVLYLTMPDAGDIEDVDNAAHTWITNLKQIKID
ncbi:hypothetical protein ACJQWY_05175 [Weissella kandleri]|uniref:hypothetical protein n=1 Tax=Weissella kandleri TaxID=1616 RepID=UPI00387EBDAB